MPIFHPIQSLKCALSQQRTPQQVDPELTPPKAVYTFYGLIRWFKNTISRVLDMNQSDINFIQTIFYGQANAYASIYRYTRPYLRL